MTEFDFRYNHRTAVGYNDNELTNVVLKEIAGKRLGGLTKQRDLLRLVVIGMFRVIVRTHSKGQLRFNFGR